MSISYKEARETKYWLRLLRDTDYLEDKAAGSMLDDCEELLKILGSILKTGRKQA
jgi:four helix bundle protein